MIDVFVDFSYFTGCANANLLDPESPTVVTLWHYYNGAQEQAFNAMVEKFNTTVGKEQGVVVEAYGHTSMDEPKTKVLDAVEQKVGAQPRYY